MSETVYLDHAATSWPKPREVVERTVESLTRVTANAGRSGHRPSIDSARLVFSFRNAVAKLLGIDDAENVAVVRGCTEGLNLVLRGWLKPGDRVLVSPMEHNAVMRPLASLAGKLQLQIDTLPADRWGRIQTQEARDMAKGRTPSLLVVQHGSNVNGVVQDVAALRSALPEIPILLDAAQTAGVLPLDVDKWQIDFVSASMHKGLLGPTGVGFCYIAARRDVAPLIEGGTGSRSESFAHPAFRPDCFESGTLNLHGIAGSLGAMEGIEERGLLGEHKQDLCNRLIRGIRAIPRATLQTPDDGTALCVSISIDGMQPDELAMRLEREFGILSRPGLHCAPAAHRHLDTFPTGTLRLSPGWGTTREQIDFTLDSIGKLARS